MPPRYNDVPPECFEGLDDWAKAVVKCITAAELDEQIASYRKIASNRQHVSAGGRRLARMQADALENARPWRTRRRNKNADR